MLEKYKNDCLIEEKLKAEGRKLEIEKRKAEKLTEQVRQIERQKNIDSIKSKLTAEEMCYIKFI